MAKEIKVIQCPKCGSTNKKEIKPDFFICNNCNTEYYLDNDDITINHNVNFTNSENIVPAKPLKIKGLAFVLGFVFLMFLLLTIIPRMFMSKTRNSVPNIILQSNSWISAAKSFFVNSKGEPMMVIAGTRNNAENAFVGFISMQTGKEVKLQPIAIGVAKKRNDFTMQHFSNGDIYVIGNNTKIFKVDQLSYELRDVTASVLAQHPEMASGIANVEFIFRRDGEGFKLINNEGKNYFYYPLNGQLYNAKEKQASADSLELKQPNETLITSFVFTRKSTQFPEEPLQLIQYTKKDNRGGPDYIPWLEWGTNYSNGFAEKSIAKFGRKMVRSWKDLTPGHNYFGPELFYFDKDFVLYTAVSTPAQNAPKILQCIDVAAGTVKWTMPLDDETMLSVVKCKEGFLINRYMSALYISNEGKLLRKYSTV